MSKKVKKNKVPKTTTSGIQPKKLIPQPKGISFSFKYYRDDNTKFSCQDKPTAYWIALIARLKNLSHISKQELLTNRSSSLRFHPIDWEDTSESGFGLPNEKQLVDTPYQFSVSANKYGRVHGFFINEINEVFYIVWLDPNHLLYP